jgi:dTDP-4-dehydrorhamnose 3,5-epimerase
MKTGNKLLYEFNFDLDREIFKETLHEFVINGKYGCDSCVWFKKCFDLPDNNGYAYECLNYVLLEKFNKDKIIQGKIILREDGDIQFFNPFHIDLEKIKRMYVIDLFKENEFRGWHGHKKEKKWCICLKGFAKVGIIKIDNFDNPSDDLKPEWYILRENDCEILYIPNGYANGVMKFTNLDDCKVLFFSNKTVSESESDDYRFDNKKWR